MRSLNTYIDHSLLKPNATQDQFETIVDEAIEHNFKAVCVSPYMALPIRDILTTLGHSNIKVATVVGFPHGNLPLTLKVEEARYFVSEDFLDNATVDEIDFVLNYADLKNKRYDLVIKELQMMNTVGRNSGKTIKCIVETCYLNKNEKDTIFHYIQDYAPCIEYIKTSTGFGTSGAQLEDVARWKELRGNDLHPLIKAAGGISDLDTALVMIDAGADRLGTSAGVRIMEEFNALQNPHTGTEEAT